VSGIKIPDTDLRFSVTAVRGGGFAKLQSYRVIFGITVKNPEMKPMKIADGLRDWGLFVKEVCVKIGMIDR
jgi:hypothetical protein